MGFQSLQVLFLENSCRVQYTGPWSDRTASENVHLNP